MKRLRIRTGKYVKYYLYVGINIPMDRLEKDGEKFQFDSGRARAKFRKLLEKEQPMTVADIKYLYDVFKM
jgi:hypothetical protein